MRTFRLYFDSRASSPYAEVVRYAIDIQAESERQAGLVGRRMNSQGGNADFTSYVKCEELNPRELDLSWR